jgi:hypothetical protein
MYFIPVKISVAQNAIPKTISEEIDGFPDFFL